MKITNEVERFRENRDWNQFHNEKDLAISISLEAAKLLECFQWKTNTEVLDLGIDNIKEELSDILIYSVMMANNLGLDVVGIIREKLIINDKKYPVFKSNGNKAKYDEYKW